MKSHRASSPSARVLYVLTGMTAGAALLMLEYRVLRMNSSLGLLSEHTSSGYFGWYIFFTVATAVLFGITAGMFAYQWRHFGLHRFLQSGTGGLGAFLSIAGASCPVCGSALSSVLGIAGGVFGSSSSVLGIKIVSFAVLLISVGYSWYQIRMRGCRDGVCPPERDDTVHGTYLFIYPVLLGVLVAVLFQGWMLYSGDTIRLPESVRAAAHQRCTVAN